MTNHWQRNVSLSEVHGSIDTTRKGPWWRQLFVFFGPAYLVSVGYMDPGNWATDLAGGSQFGYTLLWVLLMSNGMAILLQNLSARLGIVRGRDLAQANRETYPTFINIPLYILAEIAIAACDLAEVLGMAIGIQLLTGLPLIYGVCLTVLDTFLLLFLQRLGMRRMEAFIIGLIAIVGGSFLVEILLARPAISDIVGGFVPILHGRQALYIAIGIIGATVMPHNLYLHSALVQTRKIGPGKEQVPGWDAPPSDDVEIATAERRLSHGPCCRNPRACHLPRATVLVSMRGRRDALISRIGRGPIPAVLLGRRGRPRADRLRLCPLPRRRHHPVMVSAGMDAPHRHRADVAGEHHGRGRLYSGKHQTRAQTSALGGGEDLGFRASVRQWRSRRHDPIRLGAGLGGLRPHFNETPHSIPAGLIDSGSAACETTSLPLSSAPLSIWRLVLVFHPIVIGLPAFGTAAFGS